MRKTATLTIAIALSLAASSLGVAGCASSPDAERSGELALALAPDTRPRGDSSDALIERAMSETRRARATGDASGYERALEALDRARSLDASRARISLVEAWVRLGRHEFALAEALALAQLERDPDDPDAWALLGDARLELGRYDAAGDAYERVMAIRPGPTSYVRAAHFREATGDLDGASRLFQQALDAGDRHDAEGRAWLVVQLAALEMKRSAPRVAEPMLEEALSLVPEYHSALAALSEVHLRTGRAATALELANRSLAVAPHAERYLLRADALRALDREAEAREAEDDFERAALENVVRADNENIHLVDFYLERRPDAERALEIARAEAKRRPDAPTLERLARALEQNGFADAAHAVRERTRSGQSAR